MVAFQPLQPFGFETHAEAKNCQAKLTDGIAELVAASFLHFWAQQQHNMTQKMEGFHRFPPFPASLSL